MKKPGEWIAMLSGELEVTRVDVRANELLDLVEVFEVDRVTGRPTRVRFLDRVEGGRLCRQLGAALRALETAVIDAALPRFEAISTGRSDEWVIYDNDRQVADGDRKWQGFGAKQSAEEHAARLNATTDQSREVPPAA